jgi:tRNA A37 threonylcarbamoyladenosine dehydratase
MLDRFSRTRILLGAPALEKLAHSRVAVFGVGGVGGYTVEALARSGIGSLDLIDNDTVSLTNINRQIIALQSTVGRLKTEVAAERARDINPDIKVCTHEIFYSPDTSGSINLSQFDYIVDAIDSVSGKIELAVQAKAAGVPIISSMGAGNKLDPTAFEVSDIFKTSVCPLARVMRYELKKRGIKRLKVVYSKETPLTPIADEEVLTECKGRRSVPGSTAFVPSVVGLIIASEVIKDLTK